VSVVRLIFLLVTAVYLCTCGAVVGVVGLPLRQHLQDELAARSRAQAEVLAGEADRGLLPDNDLKAYLPARGKREGWHSVRFEPASAAPRPPTVAPMGESTTSTWEAASATVALQHDGRELGTVSLIASSAEADALMRRVVGGAVLAFAVLGGAMLAALRWLLSWARRPLEGFHEQIRGLSDRRYVSLSEPKVSEWVELSKSLNVMVSRVRLMLDERDQLVQHYRDQLDHDALTQTKSRESFMDQVSAALAGQTPHRAVAIVRVHDLEGLNRRLGRARTDDFLVGVVTILRMKLMMQLEGGQEPVLARLNGADFGVLLHVEDHAALKECLGELAKSLSALATDGLTDNPFVAWIGGSTFRQDETLSEVLLRVDAMLGVSATHQLPFSATEPSARHFNIAIAQWRVIIENALETGRIKLQFYPVVDTGTGLIHQEAMLRLIEPGGNVMEAVDCIPAAVRNGRIGDLDLKAVELALSALALDTGRIAVNLAQQSLARPIFMKRLAALLEAHRADADRLCFEVRELDLVGEDWNAVQALCRAVEPFGCQVGIDNFGMTLSVLPLLATPSIRYVKLSPRFATRVLAEPAVRAFLDVMVALSRRMGVQVIANGVTSQAEIETMREAGVDGYTGPAVVWPLETPAG